jgi:hypothetical protein
MFVSKHREEWRPNPILAAITDDDPELEAILRGINKPVYSINEMVDGGPFRKTVIYDHARPHEKREDETGKRGRKETGLLRTWTAMGRRYAFALDYARYLLALKRLGEIKERISSRQRAHSRSAETRLGR